MDQEYITHNYARAAGAAPNPPDRDDRTPGAVPIPGHHSAVDNQTANAAAPAPAPAHPYADEPTQPVTAAPADRDDAAGVPPVIPPLPEYQLSEEEERPWFVGWWGALLAVLLMGPFVGLWAWWILRQYQLRLWLRIVLVLIPLLILAIIICR